MQANILIKILRFITVKIIYPLFIIISSFYPKSKFTLQKSFIKLNNFTTSHYYKKSKNPKVMILLPHCLQHYDCQFRITNDINNCKKCNKCVISNFINIQDEFNMPICVATGGTLARKAVKENRPEIILACACERDLSSGIYDSYPFLVYGILNERPNGDCINTTVNTKLIKHFLNKLLTQVK